MPIRGPYTGKGSGGTGGGGGAAFDNLEIKSLWSGDIAITTANQWNAVGTVAVPDDATWLIWNGGAFSDGTDDGPSALSVWIDAAVWRALTADTVDTTPGDGTGMLMVDWGATNIGDGTPDFARRDAVIGRTSANIPLILSTNTGEAFYGASLKYAVKKRRGGAAPDGDDIPADAGYLVDVSGERGGTPPNPDLDKNDAYYNRDTGRVWIPHRKPAPDTPASLTFDVIAGGTAGYRGVRYSNPPAPSVNGDFYYNRGSAHSWRVAATDSGYLHYYNVGWSEVLTTAMNAAGDALYFNSDDVWLNAVTSAAQAAAILQNSGYDPDKEYYYVQGNTLRKVDVFTAADNNRFFPDYLSFSPEKNPVAYWYLHGQTERNPTTFPYGTDPVDNKLRLRFTGRIPNKEFFNWSDIFGASHDIWTPGSEVNTGDIDTGGAPVLTTNNVVFRLPSGIWNIEAYVVQNRGQLASNNELLLLEIMSGTDDAIITEGIPYQQAGAIFGEVAARSTVRAVYQEFESSGNNHLYWLVGTAEVNDFRGFMRLERVG